MAWNQSKGGGPKSHQVRRLAGARLVVLVLGAVLLLGGGVAWWLWPKDKGAPIKRIPKKARQIKVVKPAPAATNAVPVKKHYKDMTDSEKLKSIRDKYGDNIPDNLKATVRFLENPPRRHFQPAKSKYDIFKHRSERVIAAALMIEPGNFMVQRQTYDERFDKDLAVALQEEITFTDGDTAEQRELKQAVIETKAELAERIRKGEKGSAIMNGVMGNLYDLGRYRRDLELELAKFKQNENYSDQDIIDLVTAANQMLEKKGAKPLQMPKMQLRHLTLKKAIERRRAASAAGNQNKAEGELK